MPDKKSAGRDWEKFWNTVWYNLLHVLGVGAVLALVGAIAWDVFSPSRPSSAVTASDGSAVCKLNISEGDAQQTVTSINLLKEAAPCARKVKDESDLTACTVFGLRPGMSDVQVIATINQTGYFKCETVIKKTGLKAGSGPVATASHFKDGFHLTVDFAPAASGEPAGLKASSIKMVLGPGGNPYFEPAAMRPTIKKLIGPPDDSTDTSDEWRGPAGNIRAYAYKQDFWIVYEQTP